MTEAGDVGAGALSDMDEFVATCRWVADAHLGGDPDEVVAALCEIYRVLAARGWIPPERASVLLRLQASAVDLALAQLMGPSVHQQRVTAGGDAADDRRARARTC